MKGKRKERNRVSSQTEETLKGEGDSVTAETDDTVMDLRSRGRDLEEVGGPDALAVLSRLSAQGSKEKMLSHQSQKT